MLTSSTYIAPLPNLYWSRFRPILLQRLTHIGRSGEALCLDVLTSKETHHSSARIVRRKADEQPNQRATLPPVKRTSTLPKYPKVSSKAPAKLLPSPRYKVCIPNGSTPLFQAGSREVTSLKFIGYRELSTRGTTY